MSYEFWDALSSLIKVNTSLILIIDYEYLVKVITHLL